MWKKRGGQRSKVIQREEARVRGGDGEKSAEPRRGVSALRCYNMTLTGLCNRTGLAFGSQQTPAALTVI